MHPEQMNQSFLMQLLSSPSDFSQNIRDAWRPSITDVELRLALISDPGISKRVFRELLAISGVKPSELDAYDAESNQLDFIIRYGIEDIISICGLAWHSNQLAQLVSDGSIYTHISQDDFSIEDIRIALTMRKHEQSESIEVEDFPKTILESGRLCLLSWLSSLPKPVLLAVISSTSELSVFANNSTKSTKMNSIFEACLRKLQDKL